MNSVERQIYNKYAYDKIFNYIWRVYSEFEIRVNYSPEEYEGIKTGECRFDYSSWVNRLSINKELTITKKQMEKAIKELTETDQVIKQITKGTKGNSSIYFLTRFEEVLRIFEEKNKEKNEEKNKEQNKPHNNAGSDVVEEKNKEKNEEKNKEHTSKYTNLSIESKNNNSAFYEEIINYLNEKVGSNFKASTPNTQQHINARLNEGYTVNDFKIVIDNKVSDWKDKVKYDNNGNITFDGNKFLRPKTLFSGNFESYLNEKHVVKEKPIEQSEKKYTSEGIPIAVAEFLNGRC